MNDVLCHVVLTEGDVDLCARNGVTAIGILHSFRANCTNIRTSIGLSEVHSCCPLATKHLGQVGHLLHFVTVVLQSIDSALRQHGRHGECHVGRVHHLLDCISDNKWKPATTKTRVESYSAPTGFYVCGVCLFEAWRRSDRTIGIAH